MTSYLPFRCFGTIFPVLAVLITLSGTPVPFFTLPKSNPLSLFCFEEFFYLCLFCFFVHLLFVCIFTCCKHVRQAVTIINNWIIWSVIIIANHPTKKVSHTKTRTPNGVSNTEIRTFNSKIKTHWINHDKSTRFWLKLWVYPTSVQWLINCWYFLVKISSTATVSKFTSTA